MNRTYYRYQFAADVDLDEVEASLLMVLVSVQGLHGDCQVRLDLQHSFDRNDRTCTVDASTAVGRDFNRLLVALLCREFQEGAFSVERAEAALAASR